MYISYTYISYKTLLLQGKKRYGSHLFETMHCLIKLLSSHVDMPHDAMGLCAVIVRRQHLHCGVFRFFELLHLLVRLGQIEIRFGGDGFVGGIHLDQTQKMFDGRSVIIRYRESGVCEG